MGHDYELSLERSGAAFTACCNVVVDYPMLDTLPPITKTLHRAQASSIEELLDVLPVIMSKLPAFCAGLRTNYYVRTIATYSGQCPEQPSLFARWREGAQANNRELWNFVSELASRWLPAEDSEESILRRSSHTLSFYPDYWDLAAVYVTIKATTDGVRLEIDDRSTWPFGSRTYQVSTPAEVGKRVADYFCRHRKLRRLHRLNVSYAHSVVKTSRAEV